MKLERPVRRIACTTLVCAVALCGMFVYGVRELPSANANSQPIGYVNNLFPVSSGRAGISMCMDIPYSSWSYGTQLIEWPCTGEVNQSWRIVATGGGYEISSNMNNYC